MSVAGRLKQPTRSTGAKTRLGPKPRAVPIRSCSRWGLPCRSRYRARGGLLPHPFTLAARTRRFAFCGTFPGVAPAGRYPAPCFHGARTFLPGGLSTDAGAAVRPVGVLECGGETEPGQGAEPYLPYGRPAEPSYWPSGAVARPRPSFGLYTVPGHVVSAAARRLATTTNSGGSPRPISLSG